ncbi:SMP-30/gluconolactonase/LRE family protein [Rhizobium sp. Leaf383]|uniref:SMP-30/gluconolactonase/LRE family protein n=1 Tax=Rhizobium sp. Leaf383 TaxID=1736357 RepID=UPI0007154D10|nr:SMP-30/gluconolactonase/LRE family protein [Rhizobium sp. Leaf383]KQS82644.1 gluconolaconase [Rhizobium sp. Leaf383]
MADSIVCVAPVGDRCGEGAVWCAYEASLYWTDITRFLVHRYDEALRAVKSWLFEEPVVALCLTDKPGCLLVALGSELIYWWPETDLRQSHGFSLPGAPRVRLNDGRADPHGRFWVGSMKNNVRPGGELYIPESGPAQGILYRIAQDGEATLWRETIGISNTLCWSPSGDTFYFGDTLSNTIYAFDYDGVSGAISRERPFFRGFERGAPDGSAMDREGCLWNCRFGGGCLVRIAPSGGVVGVIEMPVSNPTTCTFGGPDLKTLYITSAMGGPSERLSGSLFALSVNVPGLPENRYGGLAS